LGFTDKIRDFLSGFPVFENQNFLRNKNRTFGDQRKTHLQIFGFGSVVLIVSENKMQGYLRLEKYINAHRGKLRNKCETFDGYFILC